MGAVARQYTNLRTNMLFPNAFNLEYINQLLENQREQFEQMLPESVTITLSRQKEVDDFDETEVCVSLSESDVDTYIDLYVDELQYLTERDKDGIVRLLPLTETEEIYLSSQCFLTEEVKKIYTMAVNRLCKDLKSQYIDSGHAQTYFENADTVLYKASMQLEDPDRDFEMD